MSTLNGRQKRYRGSSPNHKVDGLITGTECPCARFWAINCPWELCWQYMNDGWFKKKHCMCKCDLNCKSFWVVHKRYINTELILILFSLLLPAGVAWSDHCEIISANCQISIKYSAFCFFPMFWFVQLSLFWFERPKSLFLFVFWVKWVKTETEYPFLCSLAHCLSNTSAQTLRRWRSLQTSV